MEKFKAAIEAELSRSKALVDNVDLPGQSLSQLMFCLRDRGWRKVTEYNIEQSGFCIVKGKVGKWTKAGFTLCNPARVVVAR